MDLQNLKENYPNPVAHTARRRRDKSSYTRAYDTLSDEFKSVIDHYRSVQRNRGRKETAIDNESCSGTTFLASLQKDGIHNLQMISEKSVLNVFAGSDGKIKKSCTYRKNVKAVFKTCASDLPPAAYERVIAFLPPLRRRRKNIQYLTEEEITRIKTALTAHESNLSLRDKAIGLIALHTGLRNCDIAGLTMDSIDWKRDRICLRQQKTGVPLQLELTAVVGNAIYDYIVNARPKTDIPEARMLLTGDVNFNNGVISIRRSKGDDQHFVVMHDTMTAIMKEYDEAIEKIYPDRTYFFPSINDSHYKANWVCKTFGNLWRKNNISNSRAYDLRHNYATENINQWLNCGFGFLDKLLILSKSMGHGSLEGTKYYYSLVPALADILRERTLQSFDEIVPEVQYENE